MPKKLLLIEPFYGGSHKQLSDLLFEVSPETTEYFTMTDKKWHWRTITSALYLADQIPQNQGFQVLFASSVLPLAELLALRPDLAKLRKIVYFHENQLAYPSQEKKPRYFQHGYNDILTCLVADKVLFNSEFNMESFLSGIQPHLNQMPDYRPKHLDRRIQPKCQVLPFPITLPKPLQESASKYSGGDGNLHIVWPHRWEHDKGPELLFSVLFRLKEEGEQFHLSVIGQTYTEQPKVFAEAAERLKDNILHWGYQASKEEYYRVLLSGDVAVSTAKHEFFGVSMLEAVMLHCYPLCPRRLAYPEIYPDNYLYNTENQLYKKLKKLCRNPGFARKHTIKVDTSRFSWESLKEKFEEVLFDVS